MAKGRDYAGLLGGSVPRDGPASARHRSHSFDGLPRDQAFQARLRVLNDVGFADPAGDICAALVRCERPEERDGPGLNRNLNALVGIGRGVTGETQWGLLVRQKTAPMGARKRGDTAVVRRCIGDG